MDNTRRNNILGDIYEIGGIVIIIIVVILFSSYGFKLIFQGKPTPPNYTVVRNYNPDYSKIYKEIKEKNQADSFMVVLLSEKESFIDSINVLNRKIDEVRIDDSDTENKVKIIASIIAVIVAVVGFFGFRSLNDIRENTIKNAERDARDIAEKVVKKLVEESKSELLTLTELIKSTEEGLDKRVSKNEDAIKKLNEVRVTPADDNGHGTIDFDSAVKEQNTGEGKTNNNANEGDVKIEVAVTENTGSAEDVIEVTPSTKADEQAPSDPQSNLFNNR